MCIFHRWLITRTGWVYCERAGAYMDKVEQRFNEVKCKKCYMDLFQSYKRHPVSQIQLTVDLMLMT